MSARRPLSRLSWTAVVGLAAALPLSVYFYIPLLGGFDIRALLMAVLVLACIADFAPLRMPFELVWPACGAALLGAIRASAPGIYELLGMLAAYLMAAHVASRGPRWRPRGCPAPGGFTPAAICMAAMAAAGALSGCLQWMGAGRLTPTAYSLSTGAVLYGPYAIPDGALLLSFCLLAALWPCWKIGKGLPVHPAGMLLATPILAAWLPVVYAGLAYPGAWRPRAWASGSMAEMLALLLLAWLLCRLAAKLVVRGTERREPELLLYAAGLGLALVSAMLFPLEGRLELAFLAGIVAGAACPQRGGAPNPVFSRRQAAAAMAALILIGVLLVSLNAAHVFPRAQLDPRNYPMAAARDIREKHFDRLDARMAFFEKRLPNERGTHFWRARAALAQEQVDSAIREANIAARPNASPPLVAVSQTQWAAFMQDLRDRVSRAPVEAPLLDYTRLLASRNGPDAALGFLQLRKRSGPAVKNALDSRPFAKALAFLLGDESLEPRLAPWPAADLLALLRQCGANITEAPAAFPAESLPLVIAADCLNGEPLRVFAAAPLQSIQEPLPVQYGERAPDTSVYWRWEHNGNAWIFRLADTGASKPLASISWTEGSWHFPDTEALAPVAVNSPPAILIWLPKVAY